MREIVLIVQKGSQKAKDTFMEIIKVEQNENYEALQSN